MRPGKDGEIILEGSRDRRYLEIAAEVIGNTGLRDHVQARTGVAYTSFYNRASGVVTDNDIAATRRYAHHPLPHLTDNVVTGRGIADQMARFDMQTADVPLDPGFTSEALRGLEAVAGLDRIGAMRHMIRRPVAQAMLDGYNAAQPQ